MDILVIDGQGGGVGKALVEKISMKCRSANITVVGTNSMATVNMLKGSSSCNGATGENAVIYNAARADVIVGPVGIIMANAMFGEITPRMAEAITSSDAHIILVPMNRCKTRIVGVQEKKVAEYVDDVVTELLSLDME